MMSSDMDKELTTGQILVHATIGKTLLNTCNSNVNSNSVLQTKVRFA